MGWTLSIPLDGLPTRRPVTIRDEAIGLTTVLIHILILTTPSTSSWILFRKAIAFPVVFTAYGWLLWTPTYPQAEDQWGIACLLLAFQMRLIDHIFIVPENTHFRTHINAKGEQVIEPVPLPWTLHKFYWASSLFSSWRGIGWNYVSPLSAKAYNHPYKRTSTRKAFIWNQTSSLVPVCILGWATKRYMTTIGFDFFHGLVSWNELSRAQVFCHSLSVVVRVWWILNVAYIPMSLGCVIVGGVFGWKGEFWEPWGWPPIFGGLKEVWQFPGLSTVWSRSWNNGGRRWFYAIGWKGIGETILQLPVSGVSSHHHSGRAIKKSGIDPNLESPDSRDISPVHPLPTTPATRLGIKMVLANLIKSTICFALSGLLHDTPSILLRLNAQPGSKVELSYANLIHVTPMFVVQPLALAVEAAIKRSYRRFKLSRGIQRGQEPGILVFCERLISFTVVWSWLFWCSAWYVSGVAKMGLYRWTG